MSDIIHLLPDSVANQIAAGEVIQRPASVIKELVENALDAGATHIQVVVEDAGKTLVQVIDNGCGMSETDARLSFERHATSKITQATDLFALRTMGFRGEALASIAAVAQVELRTKQQGQDLGTCINIEGSKVTNQEPIACAAGSNFSIRNLFFNIPARRKFLKSNQTELSNILSEFERIALAHPNIAFTLHSANATMLELPAGNFRQRIVGIFGNRLDKHLVPIEVKTTLVNISGFVGMPSAARKKNAHQYLFVNGRFMRHPYFAKAILMAYERLIPEGQQMPFFIKFDVDPARIDVNIHPTKTEIKFEDDNAIFQILLAAVRESLGKYGAVPAIDFDTENKPDIPTLNANLTSTNIVAPPQIHVNAAYNPFDASSSVTSNSTTDKQANIPSAFHSSPTTHRKATPPIDWQSVYEKAQQTLPPTPPTFPNESNDEGAEITSHYHNENLSALPELPNADISPFDTPTFDNPTFETPSKETPPIDEASLYDTLPQNEQEQWKEKPASDFMQYQGRYIVTQTKAGLTLVEQHRAHIRILYERYQRQLKKHQSTSQRLLFSEELKLSPSEGILFEQIIPQLQSLGFEIQKNRAESYNITGVPLGTEGIKPLALLHSILDDALTGQADAADTIAHIISLTMAKKVAIPTGLVLNAKEMAQLLEDLFQCTTPGLTPDGQKTLLLLNIEKMF